jgi:Zn-dependent protease
LYLLNRTIYLNIALAVFNIIPIPPLDGSKVLFSLMPNKQYNVLMRYERVGMIALVVIMFTGIFDSTIRAMTTGVFNRFIAISSWLYSIVN